MKIPAIKEFNLKLFLNSCIYILVAQKILYCHLSFKTSEECDDLFQIN